MIYKTWVEINKKALAGNIDFFRRLIGPKTQLWAVVKSNAYGHDLVGFSLLAAPAVDGFCVDSVIEGLKLRQAGVKKQILVLGPTLPDLLKDAAEQNITITISSADALKNFSASKYRPNFHLKIDTGMNRQGFFLNDLAKVVEEFRILNFEFRNRLKGVYTHFASAKDINYPTYTEKQFSDFLKAVELLEKAGFNNLARHAAATGGALVDPKYHLDAVRIGIGLYGLWPSKELEIQFPCHCEPRCEPRLLSGRSNLITPVLSWKALISETKPFRKGDYFGYDLTERAIKDGRLAIIPIGYWHGLDRGLSGRGEVLIRGKRSRILGRVSMDMIIADISGVDCQIGDEAVIIGRQNDEEISAGEIAGKLDTVHYEIITRVNPLIKRIYSD